MPKVFLLNKKAQLTQGLRATAVRVYRHLGFLKFESFTISSAVPENPTLEPNSTSIGKTGCEVMAIVVYPRWPSAAILDFIKSEIAPPPFDPPFPITLARTKHGVDRMHCLRDIHL